MEFSQAWAGLIGFLCAVPATYALTASHLRKQYRVSGELNVERARSQIAAEVLNSYKGTTEYQAVLDVAYLRGKEDGAVQERGQFSFTYQPYTERFDEWAGIKKCVEVGYQVQMFYNQFPIGQPTRNIVQRNVEFDQAIIERQLKVVSESLSGIISSLPAGITSKVLPVLRFGKRDK